MKHRAKQTFAILCSIVAGSVVSAVLPGCQPPENARTAPSKPRPSSATTDAKDKPSVEVKPVDAKMSEPKPTDDAATKPTTSPSDPSALSPATTPPVATKTPESRPADVQSSDVNTKSPAPTSVEKPVETPKVEASPEKKADTANVNIPQENPVLKEGDFNQWAGWSLRNNVPVIGKQPIPTEWAPGDFDRQTGAWDSKTAKNIKWVAALGSQTYGNTVVAGGRVYVGTNNGAGYLKRYPADVDLGCLVCFEESTGKFLWQHSSEKLPTGRVHDWPLMGICCSPLAEGNRVWFVTSRGEIKCVDAEGFYDGEDDGPVKNELAKLFEIMKAETPADDKVEPAVAALNEGKLSDDLRARFAKSGLELPAEVTVKVGQPGKAWSFQIPAGDQQREVKLMVAGPRLIASKVLGPADKDEADVVWSVDMMKQFGTSQHNMCSCSVTTWGDLLFVNTSNGVHEDHKTIPSPEAPSFMCLNKNTGEVYWTDHSPGSNILHGQWSSPTVGVIDGVVQVIFGGGDGWVYSFKADLGKEGKGELLWKFDINDKEALLELGGRGTRNDIIATPVIYDNKVYFATGQDPEHGEGKGTFWCIDPTKRGDISEYLAVNAADPNNIKPLPPRRVQAVLKEEGDKAIPNPNSGVVWKLTESDWCDANGDPKPDGEIDDFMEKFHRAIGTCAIKNDLLFVADFSGVFFCINAKTGKIHWTHDMLAAAWGSVLIAGDNVYIGDEDGDVLIFKCSAEKHEPIAEINMNNSVYSTPIIANGLLYIANKDHLFAIEAPAGDK